MTNSGTFLGGMDGELEIRRILNNIEGIKYVENLYLETVRGTCQIDFVVISSSGLFVLEVKNIMGTVMMDEESARWKVSNYNSTYSIFNPLLQNSRHILNLRKLLKMEERIKNTVVFPDKTNLQGNLEGVVTYSSLYSLVNKEGKEKYNAEEVSNLFLYINTIKDNNRTLAIRHNKKSKKYLRTT